MPAVKIAQGRKYHFHDFTMTSKLFFLKTGVWPPQLCKNILFFWPPNRIRFPNQLWVLLTFQQIWTWLLKYFGIRSSKYFNESDRLPSKNLYTVPVSEIIERKESVRLAVVYKYWSFDKYVHNVLNKCSMLKRIRPGVIKSVCFNFDHTIALVCTLLCTVCALLRFSVLWTNNTPISN